MSILPEDQSKLITNFIDFNDVEDGGRPSINASNSVPQLLKKKAFWEKINKIA